ECRTYCFCKSLLPVSRTFSAFTTTTKSPASMCGEKPGLCLPRSTSATRVASRPRTCPSAPATYQWRAESAASVVIVLVLRVIGIEFCFPWEGRTGPTRLELATSGVTGRRSNQLNYDPVPNSELALVADDAVSINGQRASTHLPAAPWCTAWTAARRGR